MVTVRSLTRAPANPSTRPVKRRHSALSQPRVRRDLCNTALADDNPFSMEDVLDMASYLTRSHNVWTVKPGGVLKFENGDARLCIHNFGYQSVVLTDLQVAAGTNKSLDSCCSHLDSDATCLGGAYWLDYTLATQPNNVITDTSMVNVVVQGLGGLCL